LVIEWKNGKGELLRANFARRLHLILDEFPVAATVPAAAPVLSSKGSSFATVSDCSLYHAVGDAVPAGGGPSLASSFS
jgi:hypothetical protein